MRGTGPISRREQQILELMAECHSYQDIGDKLGITLTAVYSHVANIMIKTGTHKKEHLIKYAQDHYGQKSISA